MCEEENARQLVARGCLKTLSVSLLIEWDVLIFLHQHGKILSSVEEMARLLRRPPKSIGDALNRLESRKLIHFSPASSDGARFYQVAAFFDGVLWNDFQQLLSFTGNRAGRMMLAKILKPDARKAASERDFRT